MQKLEFMAADNEKVSVTFGDVTVLCTRPTAKQIEERVLQGQQALQHVRDALIQPGINLARKKDVPLYYASPNEPLVIIREMNGERVAGRFEDGGFVADMAC